MKFEISSKGFVNETLSIEVLPSSHNPKEARITCTSNQGVFIDKWNDTYVAPKANTFAESQNDFGDGAYFYEHGNLDENAETSADYGWFFSVPSERIEEELKALTEKFFNFHKEQNEACNLTVQRIRQLKIENIITQQGWEVVKTVSRKGSRR